MITKKEAGGWNMKKLYLIGDSIRMGYAAYVKQALRGIAEVYWPEENCRFAAYTYYSLGDWEAQLRVGEDCDVVHWNVGLHDVIRFTGDEPVSTPEIYGYYVERICRHLPFYYPRAKQVFATSTPIVEDRHSFWINRKNEDICRYNQVALETLSKYDVAINDLHRVISAAPMDVFTDHAHLYTPLGRELTVCAVLRSVCPYLGVRFEDLTLPNFQEDIQELSERQVLA